MQERYIMAIEKLFFDVVRNTMEQHKIQAMALMDGMEDAPIGLLAQRFMELIEKALGVLDIILQEAPKFEENGIFVRLTSKHAQIFDQIRFEHIKIIEEFEALNVSLNFH